MNDFNDSAPDAATKAHIIETMERMVRIAPELVRYVWRGEGDHEPFPEHAVMGLIKVQIMWLKTSHAKDASADTVVGPGWLDDRDMLAQVAEQAGISDETKKYIASQTQVYTTVKVRYWMQGVQGARYVLYKMTLGGAGSDDGRGNIERFFS